VLRPVCLFVRACVPAYGRANGHADRGILQLSNSLVLYALINRLLGDF